MQQAEACSEIFMNKRFLEDLLQNPVDHFAYPSGGKSACGQREAILVQDEGYKTAVTTHPGCVFERHLQSPHLLPRIGITGSASLLASLTCKSLELSRRCGTVKVTSPTRKWPRSRCCRSRCKRAGRGVFLAEVDHRIGAEQRHQQQARPRPIACSVFDPHVSRTRQPALAPLR
jgi:hypothetical protein